VALTTRSREVPAALRMADTFSRHFLVCSWIVSPTILPVSGSCGPVPETNTRPAARTAWLNVGGGEGALGVRMISLAMSVSMETEPWTVCQCVLIDSESLISRGVLHGHRLATHLLRKSLRIVVASAQSLG